MATILVAEDDPLTVKLLDHLLRHAGFEVITVNDGDSVVDRAVSTHPNLILLDGMLPGRDGLEVLHCLKETPETEKIPIILISCRAEEEHVLRAFSLGAVDYIVKPIIPTEVIARIRQVLGTGHVSKKAQ